MQLDLAKLKKGLSDAASAAVTAFTKAVKTPEVVLQPVPLGKDGDGGVMLQKHIKLPR
jgi:hypothetical protein